MVGQGDQQHLPIGAVVTPVIEGVQQAARSRGLSEESLPRTFTQLQCRFRCLPGTGPGLRQRRDSAPQQGESARNQRCRQCAP